MKKMEYSAFGNSKCMLIKVGKKNKIKKERKGGGALSLYLFPWLREREIEPNGPENLSPESNTRTLVSI